MSELSPGGDRILIRARQLLQRGWCKGGLAKKGRKIVEPQDPEASRFCLVGAMNRAYSEQGENNIALGKALNAILHAIAGRCYGAIPAWNDTPGRTQEEVLRLLDGILARARK